jgi:hypothetical protein
MSNLAGPPIQGQVLDSGKMTKNWVNWLLSLYQALGGSQGAGASFLTCRMDDVTATQTIYITVPRQCKVMQVDACLGGTPGHSEAVVVSYNAVGSMGTISIPNAATVGQVYSLFPTTNNLLNAGAVIKLASSGAQNSSIPTIFTITLQYLG